MLKENSSRKIYLSIKLLENVSSLELLDPIIMIGEKWILTKRLEFELADVSILTKREKSLCPESLDRFTECHLYES